MGRMPKLVRRGKKDRGPRQGRKVDGEARRSKVYPSPRDRKHDRNGTPVRVIEHRLEGVENSESHYRLVTTILDPERAPAAELVALYHERWEIENAFDEFKVHLRGPRIVLRSRTPELVVQGFSTGCCWPTTRYGGSCTTPPATPISTPTPCRSCMPSA